MKSLRVKETLDERDKKNLFLNPLDKILESVHDYEIEVSKKIVGDNVFENRTNILFKRHLESVFQYCIEYLKKLNTQYEINFDKTVNQLKKYEISKLNMIVLGLDLRSNIYDSRIKIWFEFKDSPQSVYQALNTFGYNKVMIDLMGTETVLIGFDFYLDNKYKFKIHYNYLDFNKNPLTRIRMENIFSREIVQAMSLSDFYYISFRGDAKRMFIYFVSRNINKIIEKLKIDKKNIYENLYHEELEAWIIGFFYDEYLEGKLREFNLYYLMEDEE